MTETNEENKNYNVIGDENKDYDLKNLPDFFPNRDNGDEDKPRDFNEQHDYIDKVLATSLLAGEIMLENGSEMYRVEDTMMRIVEKGTHQESGVFSTPTGIFVGISGKNHVQFHTIKQRTFNLEKVSLVNEASRQYTSGQITLHELYDELNKVKFETKSYPIWVQLLGAFVVSAGLMIIFSGKYDWADLPIGGLVGMFGYAVFLVMQEITNIRFISEFIAAISLTVLAYLIVRVFGIGNNLDYIIIGGIMPLVPGVPLTNAFRDLLAGHLVSGVTRLTEALLSAAAIGAGVAVVIRYLIL